MGTLTFDAILDAPLPWADHRGVRFAADRAWWRVVTYVDRRPLATVTLYGATEGGEATNATVFGEVSGVGSPLWPDEAPQPPAWFHAAATAFIRDHDSDLDPEPARVSSQAGLASLHRVPSPTLGPEGGDMA